MDVTQILLNATSQDDNVRRLAEENLKQFQEQNFAAFLVSLAHELGNQDKPLESRKLAGLVLKNSLDAKEAARRAEYMQRWLSLDAAHKAQIRGALLAALGSSVRDAGHTAAQVIAKVAAIELPRQQWPELIGTLLANMGTAGSPKPVQLKESTLEAFGYICEEIAGTEALAQEQVNLVLTAVVQGMTEGEGGGDADVRLAATHALYNALDFAQTNFENENERDVLMNTVFGTARHPDARVRRAAFECLVSIATLYYEKLARFMQQIFELTAVAAREDEEAVALQAVELWSSICDEEIELQDEYTADSEVTNFNFIGQALPGLVPLLLWTLTKQEEDQDTDETAWNLSMAGGTALGLVAQTVGDAIVDPVMPFVQKNIAEPDWRLKEAAIFAFGSILEGPSLARLAPLVNLAFGYILQTMQDSNSHVKDTTAWTLGRIFQFLHGASAESPVVTEANLGHVLAVLLASIEDAPNVAEKVCGAVYYLALGYEGVQPSPLSPYFQSIVQALLAAADRPDAGGGDGGDTRLRTAAYETLNEVVRCSSDDTAGVVLQLVPLVMQKLDQTLQMQIVSIDDRERQSELQALLCGVLQIVIQRLGGGEQTRFGVVQYADAMMALFLRVFACRSATVHEEAMLAIGALAYATGPEFVKYMPEFYKYLEMGLRNFEEYQVCAVTVGVVGDICRALEERVLPFCDGIMSELLKDLSSSQLHRSVKPPIFSCFGDVALAIGEHFEKYLVYAMPMLQSAAELSARQKDSADDELIDYNNQLRSGIFEAYSGLFQGFKSTRPEVMQAYVEHILFFIENVYQDKERDDVVTKAAVGVMGDLADTLGAQARLQFLQHAFYKDFIGECMHSSDPQLKDTAEWALGRISAVVGSS